MPEDFDAADEPRVADAVFEAVADERRRLALYYLRERESAGVEELATVVSGWTRARRDDPELVTPDERDRTELRLHHAALPKLAEAGFVSYDRETGDVALADAPDLLDAVLAQALERERVGNAPVSSGDRKRGRGEPESRSDDQRPPDDDESAVGDG